MSDIIVLNKDNIVNLDNGNNHLVYEFPRDTSFEKGDKISLVNGILYYSFFNVTPQNRNNFLQYKFWDSSKTLQTYDIVITSGFYTLATLYEYIQRKMVKNGHYVIDPRGKYVHFIELLTNSTYYSVQIRLSSVSKMMTFNGVEYDITDPTTDYRIAGDWLPPDTYYETPQLIIPSTNTFGSLIGFKPGAIFYDVTGDDINKKYSILNDFAPNLEVQNSAIITSNMVKNYLGRPDNILTSFSAIGTQFGGGIRMVHEPIYSFINPGVYKELVLKFKDNNFNDLMIQDPNMTLIISIIRKDEEN